MKILFLLIGLTVFAAQLLAHTKVADLSSHAQTLLESSDTPALALAVVVDGEIAGVGAAGIRKVGDPTPVTVNDKFHIGSCTKSMTALLGAILVEQGKLKWDTTLEEVFDDIQIHEGYRKATLHQLLTNTGGTPDDVPPFLWLALWEGLSTQRSQREQLVEGILGQPPAYAPGTGTAYSNAGFSIAGAMMERVMDEPWEELLARLVFKPLGMESAGFRAPARLGLIDQPYGHEKAPEGDYVAVPAEPRGDNPAAIAPAGAVHCSVIDFARYACLHLGSPSQELVSLESLQKLQTPVADDYAMGLVVLKRSWAGGKALQHAGSNTMWYCVMWIAPAKNFAAVAMVNVGSQEGFLKCDEAVAFLIGKYLQ